MLEDSAPAVWERSSRASKLSISGGFHESRFRIVRSCSSLSMPELWRPRNFGGRNRGTESGGSRCTLLRFEVQLRVEWYSIGTPCQKALGGHMALIQSARSPLSSALAGRLQCAGVTNKLLAAFNAASPHVSLRSILCLGSVHP